MIGKKTERQLIRVRRNQGWFFGPVRTIPADRWEDFWEGRASLAEFIHNGPIVAFDLGPVQIRWD